MLGDTRAVDGVSFDVNSGEVVGLVGHEGSGASTIVRACLGLVRPAAGSVLLFGKEAHSSGRDGLRRVGACLSPAAFLEDLSARGNLRYAADLAGFRDETRIAWALSRTGLSSRADERVSAWPGSLKVRLAVARALVSGPELLVLEEPAAGFDKEFSRELRALLGKLAKEAGVAVLVATRELAWAMQCAGSLVVVDGGRVVHQGPTSQVQAAGREVVLAVERAEKAAEDLVRVRGIGAELTSAETIRLSGAVDVADIVSFLVGRRYRVTSVERKEMSLDELLVRLALGPLPEAKLEPPPPEEVKDPLALLDDGDADLSAFLRSPRTPERRDQPEESRERPGGSAVGRWFTALAWELRKLAFDPAARFATVALAATLLGALAATAFSEQASTGTALASGRGGLAPFVEPRNGWNFARRLLGPVTGILAPLAVCVALAGLVAGEAERGLLDEELARCGRRRVLAGAKLVAGLIYVVALVGIAGLVGLVLGPLFFGSGAMTPLIDPQAARALGHARFTVPEGSSALARLAFAYAAAAAALAPVVGLALLASAVSRRAATAAAGSACVYFALQSLAATPGLANLRPYLVVTRLGVWEAFLRSEIAWGEFARGAAALGVTFAFLAGAFMAVFGARDCPQQAARI